MIWSEGEEGAGCGWWWGMRTSTSGTRQTQSASGAYRLHQTPGMLVRWALTHLGHGHHGTELASRLAQAFISALSFPPPPRLSAMADAPQTALQGELYNCACPYTTLCKVSQKSARFSTSSPAQSLVCFLAFCHMRGSIYRQRRRRYGCCDSGISVRHRSVSPFPWFILAPHLRCPSSQGALPESPHSVQIPLHRPCLPHNHP